MKRIYNAPTIEAKECAQLENVFAYCNQIPSTEPNCHKVNEDDPDLGAGQAESCALGYPAKDSPLEVGCSATSTGDIGD